MFTEQIAALGAVLRAGGLPDGVAAAFEQLLGSCAATLSSRGTVNLPGLILRQISPQGQRADVILNPVFTKPPVGVVQLGRVLDDPVEDDDPRLLRRRWKVKVDPVGDPMGNPPPGGRKPDEPGNAQWVYILPTGDGEPVIKPDDILQYSYVPANAYGSANSYVPKAFEFLQENAWMTNLRGNGVTITAGSGAPVDGTTGLGTAGRASLYGDTDTGNWWSNSGDSDNPVWTLLTTISTT